MAKNNQNNAPEQNDGADSKETKKVSMKGRMAVKFIAGYAPYVKGDIATFGTEEAKKLIKAEVAKEYKK